MIVLVSIHFIVTCYKDLILYLVGKGDMTAADSHLDKIHERSKLKKQAEVRNGWMEICQE